MSEEENVESDSELDQLKRERDMLHEQREKYESTIKSLKKRVRQLKAQIPVSEVTGDMSESFLSRLSRQQEFVIAKLLRIKEENEKVIEDYEEMHEADMIQQNTHIARLQERLTSVTKSKKALEDELEQVRSENLVLKAKHPKCWESDDEVELLKKENSDLQQQLGSLKMSFEAKTHEFIAIRKRLTAQIRALQNGQVSPRSDKIDELQSINQELQHRIDNETIDEALHIVRTQEVQTRLQQAQRDNRRLVYENAKLRAQLEQGQNQEILQRLDIDTNKSLVAYITDERIIRQEQISNLEATLLEQKAVEETLTTAFNDEKREREKDIEKLADQMQELKRKLAAKDREVTALKEQLREALKPQSPIKRSKVPATKQKPPTLTRCECDAVDIEGSDATLKLYLKRSLLQFFMQEESKRAGLVPVILEIAGCTEKEISIAQRMWQKRNSFY